jgi:hypothetical protein
MAGFLPVFNSQCVSLFPRSICLLDYLLLFISPQPTHFLFLSFSVRVTPMDEIQVERITTTSTTTPAKKKKMKEMVIQQVNKK